MNDLDPARTLVLASRNPGKLRELRVLLAPFLDAHGLALVNLDDADGPEVEETGTTFEANALLKAHGVSDALGLAALADDSGLAVDALDGRPGVYSARYGGPGATDADNNAKLIAELADVPIDERTARYVAVLALVIPDGPLSRELGMDGAAVWTSRGTTEGVIMDEARGDGGFGYDPHFHVPDWNARMAEVSLEQKNTRSHRARAVRALLEQLG